MFTSDNLEKSFIDNTDVLLVHEDFFKKTPDDKYLQDINKIKVLVMSTSKSNSTIFKDKLLLPTSIKEINLIVENSIIKKSFNKNSSIKIKSYVLDKNEKKLIKSDNYILLTEKEIQLLELLLNNDEAISKNKILKKVWKYSTEADTHTVETHIYRLRKKIKSKFFDENFIINNKNGYQL